MSTTTRAAVAWHACLLKMGTLGSVLACDYQRNTRGQRAPVLRHFFHTSTCPYNS